MNVSSAKIETVEKGVCTANLDLTNKPVSEVHMAKPSLPKKHSYRKTHAPEYRCYEAAKQRCMNSKNSRFAEYGGRGIEFRFQSFEEFLRAIGSRPTLSHTLDRIDVNGHYEAGNVRWATQTEQQRNKRNNRCLTLGTVTKSLAEWAEDLGWSASVLYARVRYGWCASCALTIPINSSKRCEHTTDRWCKKITDEQARAIAVDSRPTDVVAEQYGVSLSSIRHVRRGRTHGAATGIQRSPKKWTRKPSHEQEK
jgi:hypothetical protein